MSNEQWSSWIEWSGGDMPLDGGFLVQVKRRDLQKRHGFASQFYWGLPSGNSSIIAYRYRLDDNTMTEEEAELPAQEWAGSITDSKEEAEVLEDMVNHPPHYTQGGIECIEAIKAAMTPEEFRGYCKAAALKYIWREMHKGGDESLRKAVWYLNAALGDSQ